MTARLLPFLPAAPRRAILLLGLLAAAIGAQAQSGELVLYTSQPERDMKETIAAFNKRHPAVKVQVFRSGTTEVVNRLRTEIAAGAPRPDVLLIADAVTMESLKSEGRLARMRNLQTVGLPAEFFDAERTYVGTKLITIGLVQHAKSPVKLRGWQDLLNPALKNQVVMPSPLYSGAAAIAVGAWAEQAGLGWKYIEALKANGASAVRGNGAVLQQVAQGEKMAGVLVDFMALNAKAKGSPVEFVAPAEGLAYVTEPVAILNSAKNVPAAEAFVNFLISPAGQQQASALGYFPLQPGVKPPPAYPAAASLKFLPVSPERLLGNAEADRKRFAALFGG
ncbi:ABC transporter substrate-binding protein [Roseateles sp. DAIF2]|uniref:ABC transporter substrate-binding protein n=1 Tax=Roseateles sp. DAIF2 TaxID=2714952 RepID=UPI0018A31810|nr:ABC transporter substrate-binding protein [Roseateles sp. DAIF2]QPF76070.1 ABC transporter substrate-binding protein [Roseateles sp. DAIF2]